MAVATLGFGGMIRPPFRTIPIALLSCCGLSVFPRCVCVLEPSVLNTAVLGGVGFCGWDPQECMKALLKGGWGFVVRAHSPFLCSSNTHLLGFPSKVEARQDSHKCSQLEREVSGIISQDKFLYLLHTLRQSSTTVKNGLRQKIGTEQRAELVAIFENTETALQLGIEERKSSLGPKSPMPQLTYYGEGFKDQRTNGSLEFLVH